MAYCATCNNTGSIDCHCGGDLCVCGAEELPCPECDGRFDDEEWPECPTCHGKGTVNPLTAPTGFFCVSTTDCPTCDGSGDCP